MVLCIMALQSETNATLIFASNSRLFWCLGVDRGNEEGEFEKPRLNGQI